MILSSGELWVITSAILAVLLVILFAWKRRQDRAVTEFSDQVWHLSHAKSGGPARLRLEGRPESLSRLGAAVNHMLENLERRGARLQDRELLFQRLVETVHDAVLVHRDGILFANSRFLTLLGAAAESVIGKPLSNFVAPEYAELVEQNLRRRLAGEPAAERYEVELLGAQEQVTRVELSSTVIDNAGEPALLLTALEMLPAPVSAATIPATPSRPRAMLTLDAMGESVFTVDADGRIDYVNHAAELLLGQGFEQVVGKTFAEVAALVDEADRRSLGDPVRKALTTGRRVSMGRRAVLVPAAAAPSIRSKSASRRCAADGDADRGRRSGAARHQRAARHHAADDLPGEPRCAHRTGQPARVRAAAAGGARFAPRPAT